MSKSKSEKVAKTTKPKKVKVDNTIMNIWVNTEDDSIEQIKIPTNRRLDFVSKFGTLSLAGKEEVLNWLNQ